MIDALYQSLVCFFIPYFVSCQRVQNFSLSSKLSKNAGVLFTGTGAVASTHVLWHSWHCGCQETSRRLTGLAVNTKNTESRREELPNCPLGLMMFHTVRFQFLCGKEQEQDFLVPRGGETSYKRKSPRKTIRFCCIPAFFCQ